MQVTIMFIFLAIWLLILWIGSLALEKTGMERAKARFQALSALTGTGFTTREAESIVNHPRRRRIATWLIFIGNAGIIAFLLILILYLRSGLTTPSVIHIVIITSCIALLILLYKIRVVDKLSGLLLNIAKEKGTGNLLTEEVIYQANEYAIARISVNEIDDTVPVMVKVTDYKEKGITILAIERGNSIIPMPEESETLLSHDNLLCFGRIQNIPGV